MPMKLSLELAQRDAGSAYSGAGGSANGGNLSKTNKYVFLVYL
jgi:hypothetical protein